MIVTNSGGKFELCVEKISRFDGTPAMALRPTEVRQRQDPDDARSKIVGKPNPDALKFLLAFAEAAKSGVVFERIGDLTVRFAAGKLSIDMRSEIKSEAVGLAQLESLPLHAVMKDGALTLERVPQKPGETTNDKVGVFVGTPPKAYEEMSDADLSTICVTRGIDPYVRGPEGQQMGTAMRPRTKLIKELRASDAGAAKK